MQYIRLAQMGDLKERADSNRAADQPCSSCRGAEVQLNKSVIENDVLF